MKLLTNIIVIAMATGLITLLPASSTLAGINVSENGNSVLCKGKKSCGWLKQACTSEGGTYNKGSGGTGKCNFPAVPNIGFTIEPKGSLPAGQLQKVKQLKQ